MAAAVGVAMAKAQDANFDNKLASGHYPDYNTIPNLPALASKEGGGAATGGTPVHNVMAERSVQKGESGGGARLEEGVASEKGTPITKMLNEAEVVLNATRLQVESEG